MKKTILAMAIGAAALSIATISSAQAGVVGPASIAPNAIVGDSMIETVGRRRRRRHVGYGAGLITLGILGAIAASRANSSERRSEPRYEDDHRYRCKRWRRRCNRGNDRACWKFDSRC